MRKILLLAGLALLTAQNCSVKPSQISDFNIIMDVQNSDAYLSLIGDLQQIYGLKPKFIEKKLDLELKENPRFLQDGIESYIPDSAVVQYAIDREGVDFIITDKLIGLEGLFEVVPAGGEGREKGGFASSYIFEGDPHLTSKVAIHEIGHMVGLEHHLSKKSIGLSLEDSVDCVMMPFPNYVGGISVRDFTDLQSKYPCNSCKTKLAAKNFVKGFRDFFNQF